MKKKKDSADSKFILPKIVINFLDVIIFIISFFNCLLSAGPHTTKWRFQTFLPTRFYVKLNLRVLEVHKLPFFLRLNFDLGQFHITQKIALIHENENSKPLQIGSFWMSRILIFNFTENLSSRKFLNFPHYCPLSYSQNSVNMTKIKRLGLMIFSKFSLLPRLISKVVIS